MNFEIINNFELSLKEIIDNGIIFDDKLSVNKKFDEVTKDLSIYDDVRNQDDLRVMNNIIYSIKKFIEYVSSNYKYLEDNIPSIEDFSRINYEFKSIDLEDDIVDKYILWVNESILFKKLNNDEVFKQLILTNENNMLEKNINTYYRRKNYRLFDNISFDTALLAYDKGLYRLFEWFKDEYIDNLTKEQIYTIINNIRIADSNMDSKITRISKKISFKEFDENINTKTYRNKIYKLYSYIDEESFNYIINSGLNVEIDINSYVISNKEYVKKIIEKGYDYLKSIPPWIIDDELFECILKKNNYDIGSLFKYVRFYKFLESYDICLKVAQEINHNFERFLDSIPEHLMHKEYVIFCALNGMKELDNELCRKYYPKTLDDIKYALDIGYQTRPFTRLHTKEEVKLFILNGQPNIIDYTDMIYGDYNPVDLELYLLAYKNGYKVNNNTMFEWLSQSDMEKLFDFVIDNKFIEIIPNIYTYIKYTSFENLINSYLKKHPEYKSYKEFFIKNNIMDAVINKLVIYDQTFSFGDESFEEYVKDNYEDFDSIKHFFTCSKRGVVPFIRDIKDISKYFDKNGPTKNLYIDVINDATRSIKDLLNITQDYSIDELFKDDEKTLNLINFILNVDSYVVNRDFLLNYINENQNKYLDKNGPTKDFYYEALFDDDLFQVLIYHNPYGVNFNEMFKDDKSILSYLKFSHNSVIRRIMTDRNQIYLFFDEKGMTKELVDTIIYDKIPLLSFSVIFSDEFYLTDDELIEKIKELYKDEPEYVGYFKFRLDNRNLSYEFITPNIKEYFDENGPTIKFYDYVLSSNDKKLFDIINKSYNLDVAYKDNPSVLKYLEYIRNYGLIFKNIVPYGCVDKYFNENGYTELLKESFAYNSKDTDILLIELQHDDDILDNLNEDFARMFEYFILENKMSGSDKVEKFNYLLKNVGPKIIFNFENEKFKKLIKYDINTLNKFFGLFDMDTSLMSYQDTYNNFIVSMLNYKFKQDYTNIREIFTNMNSIISSISVDELEKYLNEENVTKNTIKLDNYCRMIKYDLEFNSDQINELNSAIMECKKFNELPLRKICRKYLEFSQKRFFETNKDNILREFWIEPYLDKDDATKKMALYLLETSTYKNFDMFRNELKESIIDYDKQKGFIDSIKMTKDEYEVILSLSEDKYKLIYDSINNHTKPDESLKKEYVLIKRFFNQFSKFGIEKDFFSKSTIHKLKIRYVPQMPLEDIDFIGLLSEVDTDIYFKSIEKNPELFNKLKKVCTNYGLGRLPSDMSNRFAHNFHINLPGGINNIGAFITKFEQILINKERLLRAQGENRVLQNSVLTFMETVNLISSVNSETYELKRLIGSDEYLDFISDKGPNDSTYSRLEREEKLELIVDYLYTLGDITIPSHDMLIETEDTKYPINFIVGNRTNPSNICHGERTGACMRVGGIGEGLFLKCLTDKNWFHIRIENPTTHEYISRVSGFRNGNTVYLNQLRNVPKSSKYSNEDLQKYIKKYADTLVEETKDSKYPIENVFINTGYAMSSYVIDSKEIYTLGYDIQKEYSLYDIEDLKLRYSEDIWTDVKNNAILLATSKTAKKNKKGYVPLKNGPDNTDIYSVQRDKIYGIEYIENSLPKYCFIESDKDLLIEKINRVYAMKEKLLGSDFKYEIEDLITSSENILDGYVSSDWYVYIDNENNIYYDYISNIGNKTYHQEEDAIKEMNYFKDILVNKYNLNNEVKHAK